MTPERHCGDCQLCCKLLPVKSVAKPSGQRCRHQRVAKGCAVYANLMRVSPECHFWTCRWLINDDAGDLRRPDRSHYVIDIMPDYVSALDEDGGVQEIVCAQIWLDDGFPDAHRDPALRGWLERRGVPGLCRYPNHTGFVIFPPCLTGGQGWQECHNNLAQCPEHKFADIARVIAQNAG
jgi:hypothetical protein